MDTCNKIVGDWSLKRCGKPVHEVIEGNPLCKQHAKKYRIGRGMDTGEELHTRYYVTDSESIYKLEGIFTNKYFVVRKETLVLGTSGFFKTNIDKESKVLHEDLRSAKIQFAEFLRVAIETLDKRKITLLSRLEKAERE